LLEEERHTGGKTLVAQIAHPLRLHPTMCGAALAPHNQPADSGQVKVRQWAKERLAREETNCSPAFSQPVYPRRNPLVLDRGTEPDIRRRGMLRCPAGHAFGSFGQDLKGVLRASAHDLPHLTDEVERHPCVEEVGHRIDEDASGRLPV
jgi:hypothetical protein